MFYILEQEHNWVLIFQNGFRHRFKLLPKTCLVHPAIGHVQIYFTLYLFAKFTCCQKKLFHVFARCFAQELLLKVNVHRKVYTAWLVLIKGLEKLLGRAFRCFVCIKMFYILEQEHNWVLIFQNGFRHRFKLLPKTCLVHPAIGHVQIYFTLYLFAKFTCCQKKLFHVFARCFAQELLLKVNVHRKVYTAWLVLIKGLEKIAWESVQMLCFFFLVYSVSRQRNKTSHFSLQ